MFICQINIKYSNMIQYLYLTVTNEKVYYRYKEGNVEEIKERRVEFSEKLLQRGHAKE